jgi:hypothetical protein
MIKQQPQATYIEIKLFLADHECVGSSWTQFADDGDCRKTFHSLCRAACHTQTDEDRLVSSDLESCRLLLEETRKIHAEEMAAITAERQEMAEYLRDGETPLECVKRNRADADAVLGLLGREKRLTDSLINECESIRLRAENAELNLDIAHGIAATRKKALDEMMLSALRSQAREAEASAKEMAAQRKVTAIEDRVASLEELVSNACEHNGEA